MKCYCVKYIHQPHKLMAGISMFINVPAWNWRGTSYKHQPLLLVKVILLSQQLMRGILADTDVWPIKIAATLHISHLNAKVQHEFRLRLYTVCQLNKTGTIINIFHLISLLLLLQLQQLLLLLILILTVFACLCVFRRPHFYLSCCALVYF